MTTETIFAIVNGAAGGGRSGKKAEGLLQRLRTQGLSIEVVTTTHAGHATTLARDGFDKGNRFFLSVGGDGTAFEVINGLMPQALSSGQRVRFAELPLGSGNSFLRDFGLVHTDDALKAIGCGNTSPCDVVRIRHSQGELYYINLLSIGFSATVGALTNRRFKRFGYGGYALAVGSSVAGLRPFNHPVRLDGGPVDARPHVLLSFSNSQFTGGTMHMAPGASLNDGKLDVVRVSAMGRLKLLGAFPTIYKGTHVSRDDIEVTQAGKVTFEHPVEEDVMIDGEVLRLTLHELEVLPGVLDVVR